MNPAYIYEAVTVRVVDGDTYHLNINLGFFVHTVVPVRLHGVDTPEMNTPEGKAARAFVVGLLLPDGKPTPLVVESYRDRQSFARWVCDVWMGEEHLADLLISTGHGVVMER